MHYPEEAAAPHTDAGILMCLQRSAMVPKRGAIGGRGHSTHRQRVLLVVLLILLLILVVLHLLGDTHHAASSACQTGKEEAGGHQ
jgi:hypothetical protein